ncbi:MAG: dethiobiotin synthase [Desulfobulbaceae bacterium]
MTTLAICGIDTGTGKSVVTGLLARHLHEEGTSVITQKPVQTGCEGRSEDILTHRRLMESGWLEEDELRLTCPFNFSFPGSPHLAARLEGREIDPARITSATRELERRYDTVLVEGAGGLMVPLTNDLLFIDFLADQGWPVVLVTSPRLGSINHTLMSLEILRSRNLPLTGLVYNLYQSGLREIVEDSARVFAKALGRLDYPETLVTLPPWPDSRPVAWEHILRNC